MQGNREMDRIIPVHSVGLRTLALMFVEPLGLEAAGKGKR